MAARICKVAKCNRAAAPRRLKCWGCIKSAYRSGNSGTLASLRGMLTRFERLDFAVMRYAKSKRLAVDRQLLSEAAGDFVLKRGVFRSKRRIRIRHVWRIVYTDGSGIKA